MDYQKRGVRVELDYMFLVITLMISSSLAQSDRTNKNTDKIDNHIRYFAPVSFNDIIFNNRTFEPTTQDILVLLHIQKTGGTTFERHLVQDLDIGTRCICKEKRKCACPRPNSSSRPKTIVDSTWLISRFSTGWICGLHPDWWQLSSCIRNLGGVFMISMLRDPLHRFVSEFRHVRRGATWKASKSHCSLYDTQICYHGRDDWANVSLEEFIDCPNNMAINRQTRMLADREFVGCEKSPNNDQLMLDSAIRNLNKLAYFGLCEKQRVSQSLFEKTLNFKFNQNFEQSDDNKTSLFIRDLPQETVEKILKLNHLDIRLYGYASDLVRHRCEMLGIEDC